MDRARLSLAALFAAAIGWLHAPDPAFAQSRTRLTDIQLGIAVDALPQDEFVDPACGTNGGPPSLFLEKFADFRRCPVDRATGLREIWFIYDDEWEYIARANRDERDIRRYSANIFYAQPIITSVLIDASGIVQGYRIVTDPRAPAEVRITAYVVGGIMKTLYSSAPWTCGDLPRDPRELPIEDIYVKQLCTTVVDGRLLRVETHHLLKPGQDVRVNERSLTDARNDFESSARLEVYNLDAVKDAPCCQASARP
jgi:hypothetical protein